MLDRKFYRKIVGSMPILCVDIIVKHEGKYLLVKRKNRPLKGMYYIPGGRVLRGETLKSACRRKLYEETGLVPLKVKLYGVSEGIFKSNEYGLDYVHSTSVMFVCTSFKGEVKLDSQSSDYKWSKTLPSKWIQRI